MALETLLLSALSTLILFAIAGLIAAGPWRGYSPDSDEAIAPTVAGALSTVLHSPVVWVVGFLVAVLLVGSAALAVVGFGPPGFAPFATGFLVGAAGAALAFFVVYGTFTAARGRGLKNSHAAAVVAWTLGLVCVVVIVVKLFGVF